MATFYQKLATIAPKYIGKAKMFKYGFNFSPMYKRSTAKVVDVSDDLLKVRVKLPISYKNKNYVGSIFGGSMFSAVDPFPMVQLLNIVDNEFVVWDKSAEIRFKRPGKQDLYAEFVYTEEEIANIRRRVKEEKEFDYAKTTLLTDLTGETVFCEVTKTMYIADKTFYKEKRKRKEIKKER